MHGVVGRDSSCCVTGEGGEITETHEVDGGVGTCMLVALCILHNDRVE